MSLYTSTKKEVLQATKENEKLSAYLSTMYEKAEEVAEAVEKETEADTVKEQISLKDRANEKRLIK